MRECKALCLLCRHSHLIASDRGRGIRIKKLFVPIEWFPLLLLGDIDTDIMHDRASEPHCTPNSISYVPAVDRGEGQNSL